MDAAVVMGRWMRASDDARMGTRPEPDDYAVHRTINGRTPVDPGPVVALEATHGQALVGFVRRLGLTDEQAADCVQEVLVRLWAELDRGTMIVDHKAWAFRAIYRVAMDEHRLRRRIADLVGRLGRTTPRTSWVGTDDRIAVWAEVDRLPSRQRQVVYLRYRADLSFEEIAAVLDITSSAARSHATQAMARLRSRLGSTGDGG